MTDFTAGQKEYLEDLFSKLSTTIEVKSIETQQEIKEKIDEIKKDVSGKFNLLQKRIDAVEEENKKLKQNLLHVERRIRKNNIAIFGINETEINLRDTVCNIFKNNLELQITEDDVSDVYQLGNRNKSPVIVEFISYQKKLLVLQNSRKLKGSNLYIVKDQCSEDIKKSKILIKHLKEAKSKGIGAYIKGNRLHISNESYTAEQLETENDFEEPNETEKKVISNSVEHQQPSNSAPSTPGTTNIENNPLVTCEELQNNKVVKKKKLGQPEPQKSRPETRYMPRK